MIDFANYDTFLQQAMSEKYNAFYQTHCSKLTQFFVTCTTGLFELIIFTTIIAKCMRRQLITLCLSIKPCVYNLRLLFRCQK